MTDTQHPPATADGAGRLSAQMEASLRLQLAPGVDPWISPDEARAMLVEIDVLRAALATAERERDAARAWASERDVEIRRAREAESALAAERTRNAPLREAIKEAQDRADGHESAALTTAKLAARAQCRYQHILRRADRLGTSLAASESRARTLREALEWIAHFDRAYLDSARTLHYDMAGVAQQALAAADAGPGAAPSGEASILDTSCLTCNDRLGAHELTPSDNWSGRCMVAGCQCTRPVFHFPQIAPTTPAQGSDQEGA